MVTVEVQTETSPPMTAEKATGILSGESNIVASPPQQIDTETQTNEVQITENVTQTTNRQE